MNTWLPVILACLGSGGIGGAFVAFYSARARRSTDEERNDIEEQRADTAAIKTASEVFMDTIADLRQRTSALEDRVRELEQGREKDRSVIAAFRHYVGQLINVMRQHDVPVPDAPAEVGNL